MGSGPSLVHSCICSTIFLGSEACQAPLQQQADYEQDRPSPCPVRPLRLAGDTYMNTIRWHETQKKAME